MSKIWPCFEIELAVFGLTHLLTHPLIFLLIFSERHRKMTEEGLMTPAEVLHWLDRLGIPYKVHKGAFVTSDSIMLTDHKQGLPNLKRSIEQQPDELADLVQTRTPEICAWCHLPLRFGARFVQVYLQDTGKRISLHLKCHEDRREKMPSLPEPRVIADEPGYLLLHEDSGLCCYCQMAEAELPEECPNVCRRCFKIRTQKNQGAGTGNAGSTEMDRSRSAAH